MENNITAHLTNVEYLRYIHLLELGFDFKLCQEMLHLDELESIRFSTHCIVYSTIVKRPHIFQEFQMEVFDEPNL
jgi:hypothetical protein